MVTKGRKPDPSRARRGTGNTPKPGEAKPVKARAVAIAAIVADPPEAFPPPESVPAEVHDVWRAVVKDLGGSNHMRASFIPAVEAYCQAVYLHAQASANIAQFGVLVKGSTGAMPNPLIKVQKDAAATMLRYADTLGLTPAARVRLGLMEVTGMSLLSSLHSSLEATK